jgi:uncharacterized caspase-like protein
LTDEEATAERILSELKAKVTSARAGDTVLFYFAGHGIRGPSDGFYLATAETHPDRPEESGIAWEDLAEVLRNSAARVIVLVDACHAGLAGKKAFATNDDAVAAVYGEVEAPLLILAASKGRQFSLELQDLGGGAFTQGLVDILARKRNAYDRNGNGVIEVSELFSGIRRYVYDATQGEQTPWLARRDLIGDFALF